MLDFSHGDRSPNSRNLIDTAQDWLRQRTEVSNCAVVKLAGLSCVLGVAVSAGGFAVRNAWKELHDYEAEVASQKAEELKADASSAEVFRALTISHISEEIEGILPKVTFTADASVPQNLLPQIRDENQLFFAASKDLQGALDAFDFSTDSGRAKAAVYTERVNNHAGNIIRYLAIVYDLKGSVPTFTTGDMAEGAAYELGVATTRLLNALSPIDSSTSFSAMPVPDRLAKDGVTTK